MTCRDLQKPRGHSYFFLVLPLLAASYSYRLIHTLFRLPSNLHTLLSLTQQFLKMGSDKTLLPRLTAEEEKLKKIQEQKDENERALRSSLESLQAAVPFNHMGQEALQMPDDMAEVSTTMEQQLGLTAPTGITFNWGSFPGQESGSQSSFTAPNPNSNFESPGE